MPSPDDTKSDYLRDGPIDDVDIDGLRSTSQMEACRQKRNGVQCTRPRLHNGDHVATDGVNRIYERWPRTA